MVNNDKLRACSLFSGCGGDTYGMKLGDVEVTGYVELRDKFCETHDCNFMFCEKIGNDITKISDESMKKYENKFDIVFGGFPCQSFSNAGKKDPSDPRGQLFNEFARFVKFTKPNVIIGENVKGLLTRKTSKNENFIDIIINVFDELGYDCKTKVFKIDELGVPQKRERLIILGYKKSLNICVKFPETQISNCVNNNLKNIVRYSLEGCMKVDDDLFIELEIPDCCIIKNMEDNSEIDESKVHPYTKVKVNERNIETKRRIYKYGFSFGKRDSPFHSEIVDIRRPTKTITCSYARQPRLFVAIKNNKGSYVRPFTIDELKEIQGFPRDYVLCGNKSEQIIQLGNAVPPLLSKHIVEIVKSDLKNVDNM